MQKKSSLALIVPCYNETLAIPYFKEELDKFYLKFEAELSNFEFKCLFIDNNSSDGSLQALQSLAAGKTYIEIHKCEIQGYGAALKRGFSLAQADYMAFLDLDNTYPLNDLISMLKLVQIDDLDIVYGARIHQNSQISVVRNFGNQLYVWLLKFLLSSRLSDVCSGMRVFKSSRKNEVLGLASNDLAFSIEFTAHAVIKKWKISEVPIFYRERLGESKLSVVKDGFDFLRVAIVKYLENHR